MGGCAGPERTELQEWLTEGSTELATIYWEGVCYLKLTWEGLVCLELKAQQGACPFTVLRDLYALKAN